MPAFAAEAQVSDCRSVRARLVGHAPVLYDQPGGCGKAPREDPEARAFHVSFHTLEGCKACQACGSGRRSGTEIAMMLLSL